MEAILTTYFAIFVIAFSILVGIPFFIVYVLGIINDLLDTPPIDDFVLLKLLFMIFIPFLVVIFGLLMAFILPILLFCMLILIAILSFKKDHIDYVKMVLRTMFSNIYRSINKIIKENTYNFRYITTK